MDEYGASFEDAAQLTDTRAMADYYEEAAKASGNPRSAANWILNELVRELKNSDTDIGSSPVSALSLASIIKKIDDGTISGKMAKDVLVEVYASGIPVEEAVAKMGGAQLSDEDEIRRLASKAVEDNPKQAAQYRAGKTSLFGFFVGQVMKSSGGRANPQVVNRILKSLLEGGGT
jgi:aspartyl-tRNA(Asn)/glutamyl-tRNA(Gln) amidotransferase subunit B